MIDKLNKELRMVRATKKDTKFIYEVVKNWLDRQVDHSVTVLKMPSFTKFSKSKSIKYIIKKDRTSIGFVHILANNEIGYYIIPEFQGRRIGTWAVSEMIRMQPRDRYFATVNNKNTGSIKLITSLGFRPKATVYEKIISTKTKNRNTER